MKAAGVADDDDNDDYKLSSYVTLIIIKRKKTTKHNGDNACKQEVSRSRWMGDGGKGRAVDKNLPTKRASLRERCLLFGARRERCHCCMKERQRAKERDLFAVGNAVAKPESALTVLPVCGRA